MTEDGWTLLAIGLGIGSMGGLVLGVLLSEWSQEHVVRTPEELYAVFERGQEDYWRERYRWTDLARN